MNPIAERTPKELLLARIQHSTGAELRELRGRELDDTPGLSPAEVAELTEIIDARLRPVCIASPGNGRPVPLLHMEQPAMTGIMDRYESLGLIFRRAEKSPADWAHAQAVAEELAHLCALALAETRTDAAGVVDQKL